MRTAPHGQFTNHRCLVFAHKKRSFLIELANCRSPENYRRMDRRRCDYIHPTNSWVIILYTRTTSCIINIHAYSFHVFMSCTRPGCYIEHDAKIFSKRIAVNIEAHSECAHRVTGIYENKIPPVFSDVDARRGFIFFAMVFPAEGCRQSHAGGYDFRHCCGMLNFTIALLLFIFYAGIEGNEKYRNWVQLTHTQIRRSVCAPVGTATASRLIDRTMKMAVHVTLASVWLAAPAAVTAWPLRQSQNVIITILGVGKRFECRYVLCTRLLTSGRF